MTCPRSSGPLPPSGAPFRAFTLIELLAVIAIIGVLAAIILPTVARVRMSARKAQSASNLRQVGSAYLMFMADNKNRLPNNRWNTAGPYTPAYNVGYINLGTSRYLGSPANDAHVPVEVSPLALGYRFTTAYAHPARNGLYRSTSYWPNPHIWLQSLIQSQLRTAAGGPLIEPSRAPMLGVVDSEFLLEQGANGVYLWNTTPTRFETYGGDHTPFVYFDGHVASVPTSEIATKWCPAN